MLGVHKDARINDVKQITAPYYFFANTNTTPLNLGHAHGRDEFVIACIDMLVDVTGGAINIQESIDSVNWTTIAVLPVRAGVQSITIHRQHTYLRAAIVLETGADPVAPIAMVLIQ